LPETTKRQVKAKAEQLFEREFGHVKNARHPMRQPVRGPRPWHPGSGRPEPTPHAISRMVHSSEARRRAEQRPFDPEAPREQYARSHHFAVNPSEDALLRDVMLGDTGYRLVLWDTFTQDRHGKSILGFAFYEPGVEEPLFEGEDYGASPMHAIDSDDTLRGLLGFLTLRPGDTDREYFQHYSPRQLAWAQAEAEELSMWAMDEDPEGEFVDAA
jgi:hypothetical protein